MFGTLERFRQQQAAQEQAGDDAAAASSSSSNGSSNGSSSNGAEGGAGGGGGWMGLGRLDALRVTLQSSLGAVAQGVAAPLTGAAGRGRPRADSGEPPPHGGTGGGSAFSYFRQGGLDTASSNITRGSRREGLPPSPRFVDVLLRERVKLQFDAVGGRIVLAAVEQGKEALLGEEGVGPGALLLGVDGELLSLDTYERLMRRVQDWTQVPEGMTGPPPPSASQPVGAASVGAALDAEGREQVAAGGDSQREGTGYVLPALAEKDAAAEAEAPVAAPQSPPDAAETEEGEGEGEGDEEAFVDAREEQDSPSPPPPPARTMEVEEEAAGPSLLLTFQLADTQHAPNGVDFRDVFPLPVDPVQGGRPKGADDEEARAHRQMLGSFRALVQADLEAEWRASRGKRGGRMGEGTAAVAEGGEGQKQGEEEDGGSSQPVEQQQQPTEQQAPPSEAAGWENPEDEKGAGSLLCPAAEEQDEEEAEAPPPVVALPDRLLEHFLVMADFDVRRAWAAYEGVRDEARELLLVGEEEEEQEEAEEGPGRLVWDPATEEPVGMEEFPLFEADPAYAAPVSAAVAASAEGEGQAAEASPPRPSPSPLGLRTDTGEYEAIITEQQRLGVTVENVLERTVVCAVARASCAFRAGMEEGCLVVGVGDVSTRAMSHKEVVDRLQHTHRPLRVRLRRLAPEKLRQRRAEMVALLNTGGAGGVVGGGAVHGGAKEANLEARTHVVDWAEQKLLSLVRLLAVGGLLLEQQQQQQQQQGAEGNMATTAADRSALWRERVLDAAALLQVDLKRAAGRAGAGAGSGGSVLQGSGLNERLRGMAHQLGTLVDLFAEFDWAHPVLCPLRWPFLDLCCQLLCADADGALAISRDARELSEGPAVLLLQEIVGRLPRAQVRHNTLMLLYRLAGSPSTHARVACCALAPGLYPRLPLHQQLQVRGILLRCLADDSPPLVRAVVVDALAELAEHMDAHSLKWLFHMLELAAKDGSPRVRNKLLEICFRVAQCLHHATRVYADRPLVLQELHLSRCKLLPFVNGAAEDGDWQVRAAFAFFAPGFVETFGAHWSAVFIDNLEGLMRDAEVTVRKLACDSIPKIAEGWLFPYPGYQPPPPPLVQQSGVGDGGGSNGRGGDEPPASLSGEEGATAATTATATAAHRGPVQRCGSWSWADGTDARTMAVKKQRIMDHLLPGFARLVADPSVEVRAAVAAATGRLLHLLLTRPYSPAAESADAEEEVDERIVQVMTPLMQRVLHDENPVPVALALLQGMRMEARVLYDGVGADEEEEEEEEEEWEEEEDKEEWTAGATKEDTVESGSVATAGPDAAATDTTTTGAGDDGQQHHGDGGGRTKRRAAREDARDFNAPARAGPIPLPLLPPQLELLLPPLALLAAHPAWRLRQAAAEALAPFQLLCLSEDDELSRALTALWEALLRDGVEIVRRAAGAQLCLVGRLLGRYPEHAGGRGRRFLEERVLPCVAECAAAAGFKTRQLGLHMVEILLRERCLARAGGTRAEVESLIERALLPLLLAGLQDPLANVKIVAASVLQHCGRRLHERSRNAEGTLLRELAHLSLTDPDRDVRFFATRACLALGFDPPPSCASAPPPAAAAAAELPSEADDDGEDGGGKGRRGSGRASSGGSCGGSE